MKLVSCYKELQANNLTAGGIGQGGGGYWQEEVGRKLQIDLALELGGSIIMSPRPHGKDSFDRQPYDPPEGKFDVAYCQLFEIPTRRPADFVYSIISDYIGMEEVLEEFLDRVRPDLMISLQYPLYPPTMLPQLGKLPNLVEQCAVYNCIVVYLPWFNPENVPAHDQPRDIAAMCTGKMSGTYPFRDAAWQFLSDMAQRREDIVVSGNPHGSTFKLSDEQYRAALLDARYYVTGGIYDLQIPPKYYEVCNYGACLVSPPMPMMEASGFVPHETYIPITSTSEIPMIIESGEWETVGPRAQSMVHRRHSRKKRAQDIARIYRHMLG